MAAGTAEMDTSTLSMQTAALPSNAAAVLILTMHWKRQLTLGPDQSGSMLSKLQGPKKDLFAPLHPGGAVTCELPTQIGTVIFSMSQWSWEIDGLDGPWASLISIIDHLTSA